MPVSLGVIDAGPTLGVFLLATHAWRLLQGDDLVRVGHEVLPDIIKRSLEKKAKES